MIIIVTVVAAFFFLSAVVAMLMVKLSVTPNWKKVRKSLSWTFGLIVLVVICVFIWNHIPSKQTSPLPIQKQTDNPGTTKAPEYYECYWKLPAGQYVNGRNETAENERVAEAILVDSDTIWADQHYMEYGNPEVKRIRLHRVSKKVWKGYTIQENPEQHCRLELIEVSPGVYAGEIVWQKNGRDIAKGTYYQKRK